MPFTMYSDSEVHNTEFDEEHPWSRYFAEKWARGKEVSKSQHSSDSNNASLKRMEKTPLRLIETKPELEHLIRKLESEQALGIDLEGSNHGYEISVCLIQISTRSEDYIVDAFKLKSATSLLSAIFANPKILKIFHSCFNDLKWLQQYFGIGVVNLFDTQVAMKHLGRKNLGLDAALQEIFKVRKDLQFQRADFRIRPLPELYKKYARIDSHFLICLYDVYSSELERRKLSKKVWGECEKYANAQHSGEDPFSGVEEYVKGFHLRQIQVFRKLDYWRKSIASGVDPELPLEAILSDDALTHLTLELPQSESRVVVLAESEYVKNDLPQIMRILSTTRYGKNSVGKVIKPNPGAIRQRSSIGKSNGSSDPLVSDSVDIHIRSFHKMQRTVLSRLNEWRHAVGMQQDKPPGAVLSREAMKSLALELPQERRQVLILAKSKYVERDLTRVMEILALACPDLGAAVEDTQPNSRKFQNSHSRFR